MIPVLSILIATIIFVVIVLVKRKFTYWERRNIPSPPASFPFGNVKDLILQRASMGQVYTGMYNFYRDSGRKFFGSYSFIEPILIPTDPDLIKNIVTKDFDHFIDRGSYINEKEDPLFAHMFNLSGTRWRNIRIKLTPTFTSGKMKMMFQTLVDCSAGLEKVIGEVGNDAFDIKDVTGRYTTDVIGSCAFGLDCNSLKDPDTEFRIYGKKFFSPDVISSLKMFCAFAFPGLLAFFKARVIERSVSDFFLAVLRDVVNYRETNDVKRKDFMALLLQLKNKGKLDDEDETDNGTANKINGNHVNGNAKEHREDEAAVSKKGLTFEEVAAQAFLFFVAGFETSSTTLNFCFYELVKNLHLQEKLREEIVQVLSKHDGKITYEGVIMEMKYMDQVINETLRKYPPVPLLNRTCTKDYHDKDSGLFIPKGQKVFIPVEGLQLDPKYFPDPEKFDPDRFNEENKNSRHHYTFLPFGEGPRNCIGLRFGVMQTKVALTALLKDFKFTLSNKTKEPFVMDTKSFINSVKDGVWLHAERI